MIDWSVHALDIDLRAGRWSLWEANGSPYILLTEGSVQLPSSVLLVLMLDLFDANPNGSVETAWSVLLDYFRMNNQTPTDHALLSVYAGCMVEQAARGGNDLAQRLRATLTGRPS